ncbi:uncharacterized protein METZ01_LOCUS432725, partial [marine metagenome]
APIDLPADYDTIRDVILSNTDQRQE